MPESRRSRMVGVGISGRDTRTPSGSGVSVVGALARGQLRDQLVRRHHAIRILEDRGNVVAVDLVVTIKMQENSEPVRERPLGRRRRTEEPSWFGADQLFLDTRPSGAPQRDPAITAMVIMEVAQRPGPPDEKAWRAVAPTLSHLGQGEGDAPNRVKLTQPHPPSLSSQRPFRSSGAAACHRFPSVAARDNFCVELDDGDADDPDVDPLALQHRQGARAENPKRLPCTAGRDPPRARRARTRRSPGR